MRLHLVAAFALAWAASAAAQESAPPSRGRLTESVVNACVASRAMEREENRERICACGAGYTSASMNDREFAIFARIAPFASDIPGMQAALQGLLGEGYTQDEINGAMARIIAVAAPAQLTCGGV
ncbi:MAG: hypothetical protein AB7J28_03685 [Hyphomonadaceae bacterium]